MQKLSANDLNASIPLNELTFNNTQELLENSAEFNLSKSQAEPLPTSVFQPNAHGWVAQSEAKKSALFGLNMQQTGFNVLVLGAHGSGRTSLMHSAMFDIARQEKTRQAKVNNQKDVNLSDLKDLVAIYNFEQINLPSLIKLPVGMANKLRVEMDGFARGLMTELPNFVAADNQEEF